MKELRKYLIAEGDNKGFLKGNDMARFFFLGKITLVVLWKII